MNTTEGTKLVGHNYALTYDLGNGRSIQVNGNFYQDDSPAEMNAKLDKLRGVLDRQRAKSDLEILRAELKQRENVRRVIVSQIELLEGEASRLGLKLPTQQKTALEQARNNLKKCDEDIAEGRKNIAESEQKAA